MPSRESPIVERPFNSTRFCGKPRIETLSPTPKSVLIDTPVIRCSASAILLSGNLPISSATIASTIRPSVRLRSAAALRLPSMPLTSITSISSVFTCSSAIAENGNAKPKQAIDKLLRIFFAMNNC